MTSIHPRCRGPSVRETSWEGAAAAAAAAAFGRMRVGGVCTRGLRWGGERLGGSGGGRGLRIPPTRTTRLAPSTRVCCRRRRLPEGVNMAAVAGASVVAAAAAGEAVETSGEGGVAAGPGGPERREYRQHGKVLKTRDDRAS